jgi:hypothetical protein
MFRRWMVFPTPLPTSSESFSEIFLAPEALCLAGKISILGFSYDRAWKKKCSLQAEASDSKLDETNS